MMSLRRSLHRPHTSPYWPDRQAIDAEGALGDKHAGGRTVTKVGDQVAIDAACDQERGADAVTAPQPGDVDVQFVIFAITVIVCSFEVSFQCSFSILCFP